MELKIRNKSTILLITLTNWWKLIINKIWHFPINKQIENLFYPFSSNLFRQSSLVDSLYQKKNCSYIINTLKMYLRNITLQQNDVSVKRPFGIMRFLLHSQGKNMSRYMQWPLDEKDIRVFDKFRYNFMSRWRPVAENNILIFDYFAFNDQKFVS